MPVIYTKIATDAYAVREFIAGNVHDIAKKRTITAALVLTRKDYGWQALTASSQQDVTLPDATTLNDAYESLDPSMGGWDITIHNQGVANLDVKDSVGTHVQTVVPGNACTFKLVSATTAAGEWYVCCCRSSTFVKEFAVVDFTGPTNEQYTYTLLASEHQKGIIPASFYVELLSGQRIYPDITRNPLTGDITLGVSDDPDGRFAGRLIVA
jgi:hypothetical protein